MQKRLIRSLALGLVLASAVSVLAACSKSSGGDLTIGIDATYPPMEFIDKDGKTPIGFDVELAQAMAKKMGKTAKFDVVDWDGIIAGLTGKRYDIIMSSMNITDERKQQVDFVEYVQMAQVFVTKPGAAVKSENDLSGKRVVVQAETTSENWVNDMKANKVKDIKSITSFKAATDCFLELKNDRADVVVIDEPVGKYYAKIEPSTYAVTGQAMKPEPVGIAVRKEDTALKASIEKAMQQLKDDGTFKQISEKWFGGELGK